MRIYDVFQEKWITPNEIDNMAPPERYIYIDDVINFESPHYQKTLKEVINAIEICLNSDSIGCDNCAYEGEDCQVDKLLNDALYYLKQYERNIYE